MQKSENNLCDGLQEQKIVFIKDLCSIHYLLSLYIINYFFLTFGNLI